MKEKILNVLNKSVEKLYDLYFGFKKARYAIALASLSIMFMLGVSTFHSSNAYAIKTDEKQPNGLYYKYVNEYTKKATYIGNNIYLDVNGKECFFNKYSVDIQKGQRCILKLHDNGTKSTDDDVVISITKE